MSDFHGHDIKDWSHYKTQRTCPGFYVDRNKADRVVGRVALLLILLLALGMALGQV